MSPARHLRAAARALAVAMAVAVSLLPAARAASFDCTRAAHPVERLICASEALGGLDDALAAAYAQATAGTADRAPLVADQRAWLRAARADCRDAACVERRWRERIARLSGWNDTVEPDASVWGRYAFARDMTMFDPARGVDRGIRVADCLSLAPHADGGAEIALNLVRVNGHSCGLRGRLVRDGQGFVFSAPADDPDGGRCRLRVRVKPATIALEDPQRTCQAWCGARASIDGTEFLRSARSARGTRACLP